MKKVFMSFAVVALMGAAVSCGCNNTKATEEVVEAEIEVVADSCCAHADSCCANAEKINAEIAE